MDVTSYKGEEMNEQNIICSSCNKNITEEEKEYEKLKKTYSYSWVTNCDYDKPAGERITRIYSCSDCFHPGNRLAELNEKYRKLKGKK